MCAATITQLFSSTEGGTKTWLRILTKLLTLEELKQESPGTLAGILAVLTESEDKQMQWMIRSMGRMANERWGPDVPFRLEEVPDGFKIVKAHPGEPFDFITPGLPKDDE
jgi:hypothetical protein